MFSSVLVLLLSTSQLALGSIFTDKQVLLAPFAEVDGAQTEHVVDKVILAALKTHSDPVAALIALQPEVASSLAEPRLLHIYGDESRNG
jgi:bacterial leucyl aminopeptidase